MPHQPIELAITVDRSAGIALPVQISNQIRTLITTGVARPGDIVPSTRHLAQSLGVSRGTVISAFDQLHSEGFLISQQGAPTRIHPGLSGTTTSIASPTTTALPALPRPPLISLEPSTATPLHVRSTAWRAAWRVAAAHADQVLLPGGQPQLREAIASHLRLSRAMKVSAHNVLVTGGSREGLTLILMSLGAKLARPLRIGVENPGHQGLRSIVSLTSNELVLCPTDESGVITEQIPTDIDALIVTPAHQYPIGGSMPATRRAALLDWAALHDIALIEDDYNAEVSYRLAPEPTLAALNTGHAHVIVLGTFSTLLSPGLSTGYVVTDDYYFTDFLRVREELGMPVAAVTQLAITELLTHGYVLRHTRRRHKELLDRQNKMIALGAHFPQCTLTNMEAGADFIIGFKNPSEATRFEQLLAHRGIALGHIDHMWSSTADNSFIISFSHLTEHETATALLTIRDSLNTLFHR